MAISRRHVFPLVAAGIAGPAILRSVGAQPAQVTLKLHHALAPIANVHTRLLTPWTKAIEQDTGGRLQVVIYPSMQLGGKPAQLYDQVRDGTVDIVWMWPGSQPDRFPGVETFELPFVADRHATANAKAAQDFLEAHLRDELRDVRPLGLFAGDGGIIHSNRSVKSLDEMKGLKLRPPTRLAGEALKALGATSVAMPFTQTPEAMANGVLDGCVVPWEAAPVVRAHELVKFHAGFGASPALSVSTSLLAMNKMKYDALAPDLRAAIDRNSGQRAANFAGAMWDDQAAAAEELVTKRGHTIAEISAHDATRWHKAAEPVIHTWLHHVKGKGLDGEKLLASARALIAKHASA